MLFLTLVVVLMILNWLIESMKWKFMITRIETISLGKAFEAVLSGLTVSFFTPNRIGEYAGRVFHLPSGKRMQATFITIIENFSQLLVTLIAGTIASFLFLHDFLNANAVVDIAIRSALVLLSVLSLLLYFNLSLFEGLFSRLRLNEYWQSVIHVFSLYSSRELGKVLLWSFLRYIVFSAQFYILLWVFGYREPLLPSLVMVAMTFFTMTFIPTFTLAEVGIRGAVSAYFFGKLTIDTWPALQAGFFLWIINLVLPAVLGALFIFQFRIGNSND